MQWTREALINYFESSDLPDDYLTASTIDLLNSLIGVEISRENFLTETPYWKRTLKPVQNTLSASTVNSKRKVTISFGQHIVFCPGLDDKKLQPIALAFVKWCDLLEGGAR